MEKLLIREPSLKAADHQNIEEYTKQAFLVEMLPPYWNPETERYIVNYLVQYPNGTTEVVHHSLCRFATEDEAMVEATSQALEVTKEVVTTMNEGIQALESVGPEATPEEIAESIKIMVQFIELVGTLEAKLEPLKTTYHARSTDQR